MGMSASAWMYFGVVLDSDWLDAKYEEDENFDMYDYLPSDAPVEIHMSGDYNWPASECDHVVTLKRVYFFVDAAEARPLNLPAISQEQIDEAVKFCRENGLPDFSQAQWILTASYG